MLLVQTYDFGDGLVPSRNNGIWERVGREAAISGQCRHGGRGNLVDKGKGKRANTD